MKKIFLSVIVACTLLLWACKKESASSPEVCFTAAIIDSVKVKNADTAKVREILSHSSQYLIDSAYLFSKMDSINHVRVDSVIKINAADFLVTLADSTPVYKQRVFFKYCGTPSNYRVIYTGDLGHQYKDDVTTTFGGGMYFTDSVFSYNYAAVATGRFNVAVVATNVADYGNDLKRSVVTKVIKTK
ncbi:hypothetical protein LK994_03030 [Ferruginibacter lapsinanis]|uniref:hypothetical protein n=1 Tax=Ferruginibacter lapsinanis TaxID=563172 RepID=UPI001E56643C|nr:hypothetical protein [Ferruginibacter lapsinanis]UEG50448.1 hypothetical protein LK994_03030 [Ferruginibacter lapsinanis]